MYIYKRSITFSFSIPFGHQGNEVVHLLLLEGADFFLRGGRGHVLLVLLLLLDLRASLQQVRRQFDDCDAAEGISQQDDGVFAVEGEVGQLRVLDWLLIGETLVLFDVEVVDVDSVESCAGKDSGGVRSPHGVHNDHAHIEEHHLGLRIGGVPDSDCPISRCGNKSCRMVVVPSHLVDCQQMPLVGLLVLS